MGPGALSTILEAFAGIFRDEEHPEVLIGLNNADDAAVYRISDDVAVIMTVDFLTPVVDDPYMYGAIAAANSLSDVYAMGGNIAMALNVTAFPDELPLDILKKILLGGAEKIAEAGGVLGGGHTIMDKEPKYGLAVMGLVHPDRILTKTGARPGDIVILNKPLGTGIIATALKGDVVSDVHLQAATVSMSHLNRNAATIAIRSGATSCTDITGFGLAGHSLEIADRSGVMIRFNTSSLPFLPGAREYADEWLFPGGTCRNMEAYSDKVHITENIPEELIRLIHSPETSGGLIMTVPPENLSAAINHARDLNEPLRVIGKIAEGKGILLD
ncbi:MAG: selenide, water dikinase SelD [Candidatus Aegiribacteria sp.]|nr:selenide, water dikinase SelD [Candidatus Aegiribacteria sp.]